MSKHLCPPSRREARRRDRREAIVEVAARSFLENGYAATTMSGIAATLGGPKGTLWNYFPSKEELFRAVLEGRTAKYREALAEMLDSGAELETTLCRFGSNFLEKVTTPEAVALHRLVVSEANRFPEMGAIFYELGPLRTRTLVAQFLKGAMDRGQLRPANPTTAARMLMSLLLSNFQQLLVLGQMEHATAELMHSEVAEAIGCFLRAYAPDQDKADR
nr:TetR/AcrR family transcriptional regulator [Sphingobium bisphenolivorans]